MQGPKWIVTAGTPVSATERARSASRRLTCDQPAPPGVGGTGPARSEKQDREAVGGGHRDSEIGARRDQRVALGMVPGCFV